MSLGPDPARIINAQKQPTYRFETQLGLVPVCKRAKGSYEFLEHTSDAYVAARGETLDEAFASAALAMLNILTDSTKVRPTEKDEIEVVAEDLESLLYKWLEALLIKFEIHGKLYSEYSIKISKKNGEHVLRAVVEGERFNPAVHPAGIEIKAVTYHGMKIACGEDISEVRVLFDI